MLYPYIIKCVSCAKQKNCVVNYKFFDFSVALTTHMVYIECVEDETKGCEEIENQTSCRCSRRTSRKKQLE